MEQSGVGTSGRHGLRMAQTVCADSVAPVVEARRAVPAEGLPKHLPTPVRGTEGVRCESASRHHGNGAVREGACGRSCPQAVRPPRQQSHVILLTVCEKFAAVCQNTAVVRQ